MLRVIAAMCIAPILACGQLAASSQSPTPPTRPSPMATAISTGTSAASPTGSQPLLFAVLEAKKTPRTFIWDTVAIAGLDGFARAKTTFTPMPFPDTGYCAGPVVPFPARVAAGAVYFSDGTGVIRRMKPNGEITPMVTLPLVSTQQMMSFAVSPDGSHFLASIITFPSLPPGSKNCDGSRPAGSWVHDVYAADAAGQPQLLSTATWPTDAAGSHPILEFTGWDAKGPRGTSPSVVATQGGGPHSSDGIAVRVDATTGKATGPITPTSCSWPDVVVTGDFACVSSDGASVLVMRPDQTRLWQFSSTAFYSVALSPDETRVATDGQEVVARDGARIRFKGSMTAWLDNQRLIGGLGDSNLSYIALADPNTVVDLGFKGRFVGTVQGG